MDRFKLLVDTNIVIGLEDHRPIAESFSRFHQKCSQHCVRLFLHGAVYDDVARDQNKVRREVTLSKLGKFEMLRSIGEQDRSALERTFGTIKDDNDLSDALLLTALQANAVDFLVTQDAGLHKRAELAGFGKSVFTLEEALNWLQQTFEPKSVQLPHITERYAYELDRDDPIFASLRVDYYPVFDNWFERCRKEHRSCWVVERNGKIGGLVIRKDETHQDAQTTIFGTKILKVSTFKIAEEFRGEKFGEQLLKQLLWFAQHNAYDLVYLTAFPKQQFLIELLTSYGFEKTEQMKSGEWRLEKALPRDTLPALGDFHPLSYARKHYPRFWDGAGVQKFCVPIRPAYHVKLFPELAFASSELPLFPSAPFGPRSFTRSSADRVPGNTIRKVYICRAVTKALRPGDLLLFYMSKDESYRNSQSITSIGIIEQIAEAKDADSLVRLTAKRSVFSAQELQLRAKARGSPVKVIDFLLVGHLGTPVSLAFLRAKKLVGGAPPQSIVRMSTDSYNTLKTHLQIDYGL